MGLGQDFATERVIDHNETFAWCENISAGLEYGTYRPNTDLLQSRNAYLTEAMHYRRHQLEY